jgi:DNA repair protein RadD
MIPRDYQEYAIQSIFDYFTNGGKGNPLVVMPTGTGKSVVIAVFVMRAIQKYPGTRVMMLTHVKELIEQNHDKLTKAWPTAPVGIFSSGLGQKDAFYPITYGGVATVVKSDLKAFGRIDLLFIDEAHLVNAKDESMYGKVISGLKAINPHMKVIGLTATDYRLGHGKLTESDHLFTDVCCDMSKKEVFNWFIQEGYLIKPVPKKPRMEVDTSKIKIRGGEYVESEAQKAFDQDKITKAACEEAIEYGRNRKKWLVFASGVEHAEHVCDMLNYMGVVSTFVHSKMTDNVRDERIAAFKAGEYQAIVNNGILTTGFDDPEIDMIVVLRATNSTGLWVQMLGRGTRPDYVEGFDLSTKAGRLASIAASTKHNCLVLDFAGNTRRLGPINDPVIPRPRSKGKGEAPVKICESCGCYNHASVRFCEECGWEFPRVYKFKTSAATDELVAENDGMPVTEVFSVDHVTYSEHHSKIQLGANPKPPTIKVNYHCGLRRFTEYICLEHEGYASRKARQWWRDAVRKEDGIDPEPPETIAEAMTRLDNLRKPRAIKVWIKEYPEVLNHEYEG